VIGRKRPSHEQVAMEDLTKFLSGHELLTKLAEVLKLSGRADLAIAYWGANASKTLGIEMIGGPVRILCDAYSGACNPDELEKLLERKFPPQNKE
jgi:hypothetical protein